jgi:Uma2 family endonuclease
MVMPETARRWTAAEVRSLPEDGKRYEVVDGELLVTPSPAALHQLALGELYLWLVPYVRKHGLGEVFFSPADVELDRHTMVQPDIFVAPVKKGARITWRNLERLRLAVEVLSPSSARADRMVKRRRYQRERIAEYWVVDLVSRTVERWRPGDARAEVLDARLKWQPDPSLPALTLDLAAFFRAVHRET